MASGENPVKLTRSLRPLQNAEGDTAAVSVEVEGLKSTAGFEQRSQPDEAVDGFEGDVEDEGGRRLGR